MRTPFACFYKLTLRSLKLFPAWLLPRQWVEPRRVAEALSSKPRSLPAGLDVALERFSSSLPPNCVSGSCAASFLPVEAFRALSGGANPSLAAS
jgi:hypothetical protein